MKPRGPLMIEHRLIEKMLGVVSRHITAIKETGKADPVFIETVVDFVRVYADRTHHGKEEDILFKALESKEISGPDEKIMQELIDEHKFGRKTVGELVAANREYASGNKAALSTIIEKLETLAKFYPEHIIKEDKAFFPSTEKLFTPKELDDMLEAFWEFDRKMIHEKYEALVKQLAG
jgi:hemerythrin-like domain-containing protein